MSDDKVVPLFPRQVETFSHIRDARVPKLCGIGWSIERGADYVTLQAPDKGQAGWVLTVQQARALARALEHYADKLAAEERARSKGPA